MEAPGDEIREQIAKGNRAFYANKALFTSKLVSGRSKLKLYWTVIRLVVGYGCETWVLKENIIQKLSVFERKILRKVFGNFHTDMYIYQLFSTSAVTQKLSKHRMVTISNSQLWLLLCRTHFISTLLQITSSIKFQQQYC